MSGLGVVPHGVDVANALAISASGEGVSEPELTYDETGENDGATGISRHTGSGEPLLPKKWSNEPSSRSSAVVPSTSPCSGPRAGLDARRPSDPPVPLSRRRTLDTGGVPLLQTPAGSLAALVMEWACDPTDPVAMLAVLKHDQVAFDHDMASFERFFLRGPRRWTDWETLVAHIGHTAADEENARRSGLQPHHGAAPTT